MAPGKASDISRRVLTELREGPLALPALGRRAEAPFLALADVLNVLMAAGLLEIEGAPGYERAVLTPLGDKVAGRA